MFDEPCIDLRPHRPGHDLDDAADDVSVFALGAAHDQQLR
jgi:hypothetical protein